MRFARALMVFSAVAGVVLLATVFVSVWQHDLAMERMMPSMRGMSWMMMWVYLPVVVTALVLIVLPFALYFSAADVPAVAGLTDEEKTVVEYLTRVGGSAEQREISKALGLSRLKTHRLVKSLLRREIVDVEPRGKTNLVKLRKLRKVSDVG